MNPAALITGGSRGIGLAIAHKLCENGYDVVINGVREEPRVTETLEELRAHGTRVIYCRGDIGDDEDRNGIVHKLQNEFESLNVLVNNAGVAPKERLDPLEASPESFDRLIRINLKGTYFLTQAIANWMAELKKENNSYSAVIITIGSISATVVSQYRGDYCMSKAALAMHTKIWAVRMAEFGIPVYEVRPGVVRTDMTYKVRDKYDKLIANGLTVQPRWGTPEDVGKAVLSLVRGDFPYSTGEVFMVDGGLTLPRL